MMGPTIKEINGVQFSILGPDEIRKMSVVEVTRLETYEKDIPVVKGLFDIRMGTTDMGAMCNTCGLNNKGCPGHFGHIELARPVYHYHFIDVTMNLLKCICFRCGGLLVDKESVEHIKHKPNKSRWKDLCKLCSNIDRCGRDTDGGCGCKQPDRYKLNGISGIQAIWKDVNQVQNLSAEYVRSLFEKITEEDMTILGFNSQWCKPEWLICSVLPVPPPAVRPSVKRTGDSQRMEDDLTYKLGDIIKYNNGLRKKIENENRQEIINDYTDMLQYHVATLVDNELAGGINQSVHRSGRPLKAIRQRLKGKEGRIRNNLMGKRVDFSARSVITPDPNIDLDQLGVPNKIAINLTIPETVNQMNKEKLMKYIQNGPYTWPGAKNIVKHKLKTQILITPDNKDNIILEEGDIVNRHLLDGDYVLFNRQPSLHKMSMMGHRVKVMKGNTFRLNVSVTTPYNADFDGDEMNMHVPQSIHARSELINIATVNNHIISPRENKPIITIVQDTLLGIYKLTNSEIIHYPQGSQYYIGNNTNLYKINESTSNYQCVDSCVYTKTQMMNIISMLSTYNGVPPESDIKINRMGEDIELWSGKCILSFIIPKLVNLHMPNGKYDRNKENKEDISELKSQFVKYNTEMNFINIINGDIKNGTFDKGIFTKTSKGLIHTICNDFGNMRAYDFINDLQRIVSIILMIEGFSVGISDMIADKATNEKLLKIISDKKMDIENIMKEVHLNIFEDIPGKTQNEFFEMKVNSILNDTTNETGSLSLSNLDPKNRISFMINSGSKGKPTNISQIIACLGQQNVDGKRIPYGFQDRTLPHYYKYDDSSEARGFVENSFISGQTPQEFFFHAMGGREGLIDTACKTSETGYVQRQLVKAMEDLMVNYDYSVRGSSSCIVQFKYGNDGMDATYIESQPLYLTKLSYEKLVDKYYYDKKTNWTSLLDKTESKGLKTKKNHDKLEKSFLRLLNHRDYLFKIVFKGDIENNINFTVHIQRIVENICRKDKKSNISPIDILDHNETIKKELKIDYYENYLFGILIDIHLHPKVLINEYKIKIEEYNQIKSIIIKQYNQSKISPGEMVGALAAQSIGEPATQMTLNTFHFAGVSAKSNVTRGIPRLKELLHISKNLKSPATTIFIDNEISNNLQKCKYIKNRLDYTILKDLVVSSEIYYDPKHNVYETDIETDQELLMIYKEFIEIENPELEFQDNVPWIIRLTFDKEVMLDKGVVMEDIHLALMNYDIDKLQFIYTDDNAKELIGRISMNIPSDTEFINGIQDQSDIISIFKNINEDILNNIVIKGISNISGIVISENHKYELIDNDYKNEKQYILEADGNNLLEIMNQEYIDTKNTYSNNIIEINDCLGIEAAREVLGKEIKEVVDHAGEYINERHIELLCDIMTCKGELVSINRQGINRGDVGPLAKCSFEDTTDQLIKASIFSEKDHLKGVSANIMMGQTIKSGTGLCDILFDEEEYMKLSTMEESIDSYEVEEDNIEELMNIEEETDCQLSDFKFSFE